MAGMEIAGFRGANNYRSWSHLLPARARRFREAMGSRSEADAARSSMSWTSPRARRPANWWSNCSPRNEKKRPIRQTARRQEPPRLAPLGHHRRRPVRAAADGCYRPGLVLWLVAHITTAIPARLRLQRRDTPRCCRGFVRPAAFAGGDPRTSRWKTPGKSPGMTGPRTDSRLEMPGNDARQRWLLRGSLYRGDERVPLEKPVLMLNSGVILFDDRMAGSTPPARPPGSPCSRVIARLPFPTAIRGNSSGNSTRLRQSRRSISAALPPSRDRVPAPAGSENLQTQGFPLVVRAPRGPAVRLRGILVPAADRRLRVLQEENQRLGRPRHRARIRVSRAPGGLECPPLEPDLQRARRRPGHPGPRAR
jgi:hypothetical protein